MTFVRRPGPERLPAHVVPGGVVLHVYDARGTRLLARTLTADDDPAAAGVLDAEAVTALAVAFGPVVLVVFDGDTGERHPAWVGVPAGTQL